MPAPAAAGGGNQVGGRQYGPGNGLGGNQVGVAMGTGSLMTNPATPQPLFAANLGVFYVPVRYGDGTFGLSVSQTPQPGTPAAQLQLDPGDVIFALDNQRFTSGTDVANHYNQTSVDYVDSATNTRMRGVVMLGPQVNIPMSDRDSGSVVGAPALADGGNQIGDQSANTNAGSLPTSNTALPPNTLLAANLGVVYVPVRYGDGTFGLSVIQAPLVGTPAAQLQLSPGDVIFSLDGQRFNSLNDVANHYGQTTIEYIDAETNSRQNGNLVLPPQNP